MTFEHGAELGLEILPVIEHVTDVIIVFNSFKIAFPHELPDIAVVPGIDGVVTAAPFEEMLEHRLETACIRQHLCSDTGKFLIFGILFIAVLGMNVFLKGRNLL